MISPRPNQSYIIILSYISGRQVSPAVNTASWNNNIFSVMLHFQTFVMLACTCPSCGVRDLDVDHTKQLVVRHNCRQFPLSLCSGLLQNCATRSFPGNQNSPAVFCSGSTRLIITCCELRSFFFFRLKTQANEHYLGHE